ncbi:uncharacterized protein MKK02DRAFT_16298 [Dioszegia hungarica]|uniref:Glycosyltransferase family 32 protein n=1 Tax=Dioszegia hungarica TaxID=4972 RepID=A0AA38H6L3_9TREE|nr:uncharacterized protein MKK02DRAFT_16298 [Dioszegia hungarica]KAI9634641.1 hypothetical protein MKK02DRAFT_16298 [Dioszegia hungarica]
MLPLATNSRTRSAARDVLERTSGYLTDLDEAAMNEVWGYELHNLTYDAYVTDLMDMYQEFFVPLTQADPHGYKSSTSYLKDIKHRPLFKPFLDQMAAFLSFLPVRSCPLTRKIHTTMKSYPADLHEEFGTWTSKNPGWKLDYTTDPDWDRWLEEEFRGTGLAREFDAIKADNRVIGGDLVRYLLVLIEGGLYTDSDTAAELPVAQWGEKFFEQPVPRLPYDILSDIDDVLPACVSQKQMEDQDQDKEQDDPPSFIIAQEFDYVDWRHQDKASRREVSQWTFYAARGHPILLDALGRSLRAVKEKRLRMGGGKWEMSGFHEILRLAGPTSLANALQRYLIVRYGITPEKLPGITTSLRIGDVL